MPFWNVLYSFNVSSDIMFYGETLMNSAIEYNLEIYSMIKKSFI